MSRLVLMAIRPNFANLIYSRQKLFEYRRVRTSIRSGDRVLIYESGAGGFVTGEFWVGKVLHEAAEVLAALEQQLTVRRLVDEYLVGSLRGSAMEVVAPQRWTIPMELRALYPRLRAPQSYLFLY
jgi:predicted transcriptional regulator